MHDIVALNRRIFLQLIDFKSKVSSGKYRRLIVKRLEPTSS
jgi:hypothetical protein